MFDKLRMSCKDENEEEILKMNKLAAAIVLTSQGISFLHEGDKYAAIKGKWRIPVATLLGFSFAGGAIGGIIAMYLFHHKTQKNYFAVGLPMMIVTQIVVLFYCMNAPW